MKGILAILIAGLMVAAMIAPAMGTDTSANVNDALTVYTCDATLSTAPTAGSDGQVDFTLTATDDNGDDDIFAGSYWAEWTVDAVTRTTLLTDSTGVNGDLVLTFTGSDAVPYTTPEDTYMVDFYKDDGDSTRNAGDTKLSCTDTFTVGSYVGYEIDFSAVSYETVNVGVTTTVTGDGDMVTTGAPTIKNTGNKVMDVTISASDMTGVDTISKANLGAAVGALAELDLGAERTFNANIDPDNTANINYTLTAPTGSKPGVYSGTTTVTGIESLS